MSWISTRSRWEPAYRPQRWPPAIGGRVIWIARHARRRSAAPGRLGAGAPVRVNRSSVREASIARAREQRAVPCAAPRLQTSLFHPSPPPQHFAIGAGAGHARIGSHARLVTFREVWEAFYRLLEPPIKPESCRTSPDFRRPQTWSRRCRSICRSDQRRAQTCRTPLSGIFFPQRRTSTHNQVRCCSGTAITCCCLGPRFANNDR